MARKIASVIPARGGSKGLPRKNVRLLQGRPLIAYTVMAAKAAACIDRVFVSTDDDEIADVSRVYGAEVIRRPAEISGDTASSESALLHALASMGQLDSYCPDMLVFLQCTSPFTRPEDIDGTVMALLNEQADTALSVAASHRFLWRKDEDGDAIGVNHCKAQRPRRQEREPEYVETGAVYAMSVDGFLRFRHRFFGKTAMYVVPPERVLEIDDLADFEMASALMTGQIPPPDVEKRARKVRVVVCDVDGVLTDAGMYYSEKGDELKKFNTRDGVGVEILRGLGVQVGLMTREDVDLVTRRAGKIRTDFVYRGVLDKGSCLEQLACEREVSLDEICFVGDDIHDLPALRRVGLACCPLDAHGEVQSACHVRLQTKGGHGCLRQLAELIRAAQEADGKRNVSPSDMHSD